MKLNETVYAIVEGDGVTVHGAPEEQTVGYTSERDAYDCLRSWRRMVATAYEWSVVPVRLVPVSDKPLPEPDITVCPGCGGDADNGFSREIPPSPYACTKCEARLDRETHDA